MSESPYRPRTRWCLPAAVPRAAPPAVAAPLQAVTPQRSAASSVEALLASLRESLARGHWKVALQRYLMLQARELGVPESEESRCRRLMASCPEAELRKIRLRAAAWAAMRRPEP